MSTNTEDERGRAAFLYPLQRYTRTDNTVRELSEMAKLPRSAALKCAASGETGPAWETLVAMARAYLWAGDSDAAQRVLDALVRRVSPTLGKKVASWAVLTPEDRTDAKQEAIAAILRGVLSLTPGQELWECNFTHCFNQRLLTIWQKAARRYWRESAPVTEDREGEEQDRLEQTADSVDAFAQWEDDEFCSRLTRAYPQIGRMIHLRLRGFSDREIAAHLGVTDRTLRNWAKTAQALWDQDKS